MIRRRFKAHISFISAILVIAFVNLAISPSHQVPKYSPRASNNLAAQCMFKPPLDIEKTDECMLEALFLNQIMKFPRLLSSYAPGFRCLFSHWGGKDWRILYEDAIPIELKEDDEEDQPTRAFIVPAYSDNVRSFIYAVFNGYKEVRTTIYSEEEFDEASKELIKQGKLTAERIEHMKKWTSVERLPNYHYSFDITDESVRAVFRFLQNVGAESPLEEFREIVSTRNLMLHARFASFVGTAFAVIDPGDMDAKKRAEFILDKMLGRRFVHLRFYKEAFEAFWELWEENRASEFDLDKVSPELSSLIKRTEREGASNEGDIRFRDEVYTSMIDLRGVELSDCEETIADIKRIYREVAEHHMKKHNEKVEKEGKGNKILAKNMPGLDPGKIRVERFSECLIPSDIVFKDGLVILNEYDVKRLTLMRFWGWGEEAGDIYDYPFYVDKDFKEKSPEPIGNLYESIIYSRAIHTIAGHFRVNEMGVPILTLDEGIAHGERGGERHIYVNLLAQLFDWIVNLEQHDAPDARARLFMQKYPHIFRKLTETQRKIFPDHLKRLYLDIRMKSGVSDEKQPSVWTGVNPEYMDRLLAGYADEVSREEGPAGVLGMKRDVVSESLPLAAFQLIYSEEKGLTREEIADRFPETVPVSVYWCLGALVEAGIVTTSEVLKTGERIYKPALMTPQRRSGIEKILERISNPNELKEKRTKGRIYKEIETQEAHDLLDAIDEESQKIILAVEMEWVPNEQKDLFRKLLQEVNKFDTVRVVIGTSDDLASKLIKAREDEGIPYKDVVVLASERTLIQDYFKEIKTKDDNDTEGAVLAGVGIIRVKRNAYIRFLWILTKAMRMRSGKKPISEHPSIWIDLKNHRTVIFYLDIPEAEEFELETLIDINNAKIAVLSGA